MFDDPADLLISVGFSDGSTTDTNGFFQHAQGNAVYSPSCGALPVEPTLVCDSFVTIGLECIPLLGGTIIDQDFDFVDFQSNGLVSGGWYNGSPSNGQGTPDANGKVLVAQFSVKQNKDVTGTLSVFAKLAGADDVVEYALQAFDCFGESAGGGGGGPASAPQGEGEPLGGGPLGPGTIWHVDEASPRPEGGQSWCTAFTDLQDALDNAVPGDRIHVAQGIYKPGAPFAPRTTSYVLKDGVRILGGFEGGCGNPDADNRDIKANVTILDGDLNGDDNDDFGVLSQPDAVYTNNTSIFQAFSEGVTLTSISHGTLTIEFVDPAQPSEPLILIGEELLPCGANPPWGEPPFVEPIPENPIALAPLADNISTVRMNFSQPLRAFGLEALHNLCQPEDISLEFWSGPTLVGTVTRVDITEARLFAASSDMEQFTHVVLSTTDPTKFAFARPRYLSDFIDFTKEENVYHVVDGSGTASSAILDGFTVTAGFASGDGSDGCGSGIYVGDGSPTIQNCTFSDNFVPVFGAGMCIDGGDPAVTNCTFLSNTAIGGGAGVAMRFGGGSPVFTGCLFDQNTAVSSGGGVHVSAGTPEFHDCEFTANSASAGAGLTIDVGITKVINCRFEGNSADGGGAIAVSPGSGSASVELTSSTLIGNTATQLGSAFFSNSSISSVLTNCLITGNTAASAVTNFVSIPIQITNCTIWANTFSGVAGQVDMDNSIVWGNGDGSEQAQVFPVPPIPNDVAYSCIESCSGFCPNPSSTNTGADPDFADRNGPNTIPGDFDDDLRPLPGAPVNDAGDNTAVPVGITTDILGNPRFVDDSDVFPDPGNGTPPIVDMGAYELPAHCGSCPWDTPVNGPNGSVGPEDLAYILGNWGPFSENPACNPECPAALVCIDNLVPNAGNLNIGPEDLAKILGNWGPCP